MPNRSSRTAHVRGCERAEFAARAAARATASVMGFLQKNGVGELTQCRLNVCSGRGKGGGSRTCAQERNGEIPSERQVQNPAARPMPASAGCLRAFALNRTVAMIASSGSVQIRDAFRCDRLAVFAYHMQLHSFDKARPCSDGDLHIGNSH